MSHIKVYDLRARARSPAELLGDMEGHGENMGKEDKFITLESFKDILHTPQKTKKKPRSIIYPILDVHGGPKHQLYVGSQNSTDFGVK